MTQEDLESHIRGLGYTVETIHDTGGSPYSVVRNVTAPNGSLAGRVCDVALQSLPAAPFQVPAAIHTKPALVPMSTCGTQNSNLGPEWQYWSRRFDRPPTPQMIWAHVLTVLGEV